MSTISRPALGLELTLGALYDARTDKFLPTSPFSDGVPSNASSVTWQEERHLTLVEDDTQQSKFKLFGLSPSLAASCLAGWVSLKSSAQLLLPTETKIDEAYHGFYYTSSTVIENLHLDEADIRETIENAALGQEVSATHVVTQVLWGGSCSIAAFGSVQDRREVSRRFARAMQKLQSSGSEELELKTLLSIADDALDTPLQLQGYADLLPQTGHSLTTLTQCKEHLEKLHNLSSTGYGEARPLSYVLTPVTSLFRHTELSQSQCGHMDPAYFQQILELYDGFDQVRRLLENHAKRLKTHRSSVGAEALVDVHDAIEDVKTAKLNFKGEFCRLLASVRARQASHKEVRQFVDKFSEPSSSSPKRFLSVTARTSTKLDFLELLGAEGATFVEYQSMNHLGSANCYVFYFSDNAMMHPSWQSNLDLVMHLLKEQASVLAVDCDKAGAQLGKARVSKIKNGKAKIEDMIEQRKQEAALCFIKFDRIDSSVKDAPSQRKPVRLACPGASCSKEIRGWICLKCRVKVEYSSVDDHLYCDCGRATIDSASFNCQQGDDQNFSKYHSKELSRLLKALPTPPEINVLILGETGVGKSTFINSFINYLSFEKLDEALAARDLNWIIPCSFSTQSESADGRLIKKEVQIGQDKDEHDGSKGESATQQATVYPVYFGGGLIRLIDTPGIGDTRGPEQDRQNMINILQVLRNYEKLHGILILLKPNNARLTVMFKFCVKELLTQLHRNAAENMVFGFTNTRGSNYQAGDTFEPLEVLLKDYEDVIPGLFKETVYCFDSESFRYLAARHKGIDMGHIEDYRRSWDHSATEARRMVAYFQTKKPHEVKSTVSLNETRHLIAQLIQPMAQITTAIADTVKQSEEKIKDLSDTRLSGTKLRAKLNTTKTVIDSKQLDKPRTVCSNSRCCSYTSDPSKSGQQVTLFKSMCHDPCYLTDVPPGIIGAKQIPPCAAFNGYEHCQVCRHHWTEHQHVIVEYHERTETTTDPMVQKALANNADEASAKQVQINVLQTLIKELQDEHRMIQESQARFSHYLQQHSITHYNDATIEYYEHLIKDEKTKVSRGSGRIRLEQLEKDKNTYADFVNAMKKGKQGARHAALDEDGVYLLVSDLYGMKHYGKNLKDCAKRTGKAYAATFRERPYRVRRRNASSDESDLFRNAYPSATISDFMPSIKDMLKPKRILGSASLVESSKGSKAESSKASKPPAPPKPHQGHRKRNSSLESPKHQTTLIKTSLDVSDDSDDNYNKTTDAGPPPLITQRSSSGVKNHFFAEEAVPAPKTKVSPPPSYRSRNDTMRSSTSQAGQFPTGPGVLGHGSAVPVMLNSGDPQNPYGPANLKRGKTTKLLSGLKDKLKKKN